MMWQLGFLTTVTWVMSIIIIAYYKTKTQKYKPEEAVKQEINKIAEKHGTKIKEVEIEKPETIEEVLKEKKNLQQQLQKKEKKLQELQEQLGKQNKPTKLQKLKQKLKKD